MNFALYPWLKEPFETFVSALSGNRLPGSVIFSCPNGLGGPSLAFAAARAALCLDHKDGSACACRSCELMNAGTHPDYLRVRASDAAMAHDGLDLTHSPFDSDDEDVSPSRVVRIDALRQMSSFLNESASLGWGKCAVISEAQLMRQDAASAVLKTFEEPPQNTLIIMMATSLDLMLPTILSRAFKIQVHVPAKEQGVAFIRQSLGNCPDEQASLALCLAGGAPLGALDLLKGDEGTSQIAGVLAALSAFAQALDAHGAADGAVNALLKLSPDLRVRVLSEFVLEDLKYKAGVRIERLPLLALLPCQKTALLSADHLMNAYRTLQTFRGGTDLMPPRAPAAMMRAWVNALKGKDVI